MNPVHGSKTLRVIADPTRASILRAVLIAPDGRMLVARLAEQLGLRQPTVSHHMKALFEEGIVQREPDGRRTWYSVPAGQADRIAAILGVDLPTVDPETVLARVVRDLSDRFRGTFGPETVDRYVRESYALLRGRSSSGRPSPSLAAGFAADRLDALARGSATSREVPEVLFVCVQNAGRSQMASAILRHLAGDRVHVRTAGSDPTAEVRGTVVTALDEIGVPIAGEYPKPLTDEVVRAADVVVTMGCGDACPIYPGRRYLDWELEDPVGKPLSDVRDIRDDIEHRVRDLLTTLTA